MKRSSFIKSLGFIVASPKIIPDFINTKQVKTIEENKYITLSALKKANLQIKEKFKSMQYEQ